MRHYKTRGSAFAPLGWNLGEQHLGLDEHNGETSEMSHCPMFSVAGESTQETVQRSLSFDTGPGGERMPVNGMKGDLRLSVKSASFRS